MGHNAPVYGSGRSGTPSGVLDRLARVQTTVLANRWFPLLLMIAGVAVAGLVHVHDAKAQTGTGRVKPVQNFDVDRYMGRWYELGRFPNRFQKKCTGDVVVFYARRPDGRLDVRNTCATAAGTIEAVGVGRRVDASGPASVLEVRFAPAWLSFLPVWGDYWIIDLAEDYSTAVVGTPSRDYLWILSRTPHVDEPTWLRLIEAARGQGYDVSRVQRTTQR
jgi:apolipoprotein D and lipocalin family protein